jgi:hypothetical protein
MMTTKLPPFFATLLLCLALAGSAHAGPVELFSGAFQDVNKPSQIIAPYVYGGGGLFISADSGKTFSMMCSASGDPNLITQNTDRIVYASGAGAAYIGLFGGMWKGDENGCGFKPVPELMGRVVSDIKGDPTDPKRTYVATSDGGDANGNPKNNGLLMNDGTSDAFMLFGKQEPIWVESINVVKNGTGRRIYETGVTSVQKTDPQTMMISDDVHYYVRVSDDDGATFTQNEYDLSQFGPMDPNAEFKVVTVDPQNPDHVYAVVRRDMNPDTVLYNPMQGKAGAWVMVTEVGDLEAMEFAPDGKLYFGDDDQMSPALFVVAKPGDPPTMLSNKWKVGCLHYDTAGQRMLACHDWQFGTADLTSGDFSTLYDMRCADKFVDCPGQDSMHTVCQTQLLAAFCGVTHYPAAPVCIGYDQGDDASVYFDSLDYTCNGPIVTPKVAGTTPTAPSLDGGVPMSIAAGSVAVATAGTGAGGFSGGPAMPVGTAGQSAVVATAGAPAAGAAAPAPTTAKSGCSVSAPAGAESYGGAIFALLGGLALIVRRRTRGIRRAG